MREVAAPLPARRLPPGRPRPARGDAAAHRRRTSSASRPTTARASRGSPSTRSAGSAGGAWRSSRPTGTSAGAAATRSRAEFCALGGERRRAARRRQLRPERAGTSRRSRATSTASPSSPPGSSAGGVHAAARPAGRRSGAADRRRPGARSTTRRCCATPRGALDGVVGSSNADPERAARLPARVRARLPRRAGRRGGRRAGQRLSRRRRGGAARVRAGGRGPGAAPARRWRACESTCSAGRCTSTPTARPWSATSLVRIGGGAEPALVPLRRIPGVDQSIGGLLDRGVAERPAGGLPAAAGDRRHGRG